MLGYLFTRYLSRTRTARIGDHGSPCGKPILVKCSVSLLIPPSNSVMVFFISASVGSNSSLNIFGGVEFIQFM